MPGLEQFATRVDVAEPKTLTDVTEALLVCEWVAHALREVVGNEADRVSFYEHPPLVKGIPTMPTKEHEQFVELFITHHTLREYISPPPWNRSKFRIYDGEDLLMNFSNLGQALRALIMLDTRMALRSHWGNFFCCTDAPAS